MGGRVDKVVLFACIWGASFAQVWAQTPSGDQPQNVFSLLNLVKSPPPVTVTIGSEPVGIGQMPFGFYTGIVNWTPSAPLAIAAEGMKTATIEPDPKDGPRACPLYVVFDVKEIPADGGPPETMIKAFKVAAAASRPASFIDAVNFTANESLGVKVGSSSVTLPRRKRTRLSSQLPFDALVLPDGPQVTIGASEEGGVSVVIVLYEDESGKIAYAVAPDVTITP
jgi:hypothetical protein